MHLTLLFSSHLVQFIDTPGNLPPSMNLTRQLNLRRDSNLSATYRWVLQEPPLPPTHLRAYLGSRCQRPFAFQGVQEWRGAVGGAAAR